MKAKRGAETLAYVGCVAAVGAAVAFAVSNLSGMSNSKVGGLINAGAAVGENSDIGPTGKTVKYTSADALTLKDVRFEDRTVLQASTDQAEYDPTTKNTKYKSGSTSIQMGIEGIKKR
jgi:hypothetical protein